MAKLILEVELDYDPGLVDDPVVADWFFNELLSAAADLVLHSNDLGDALGKVTVMSVREVVETLN
jgi:hypothetical protein